MATEFTGWYRDRHGTEPDEEAVGALAGEWMDEALPETWFRISPARLQAMRALIGDWIPDEVTASTPAAAAGLGPLARRTRRARHHKARLFKRVLDPAFEPSPVLARGLDRLNRWGAAVVHPICLHVQLAYDAEKLTEQEAAGALRVVESYLVRRMIVGIPTNNVNRILMSLVKDLGGEAPTAGAITKVLSGPRKRFPTDQHVRDAVLANNFYWTGRGPQRTFVLRSLEEDYQHGEPVDFSRAELTIEHVLPQSPTQEWLDTLAEEADGDETPEEVHAVLVHTLGNLTLTAYNAKLANAPFATKRQLLAKSGLAMNHDIAAAAQWGRAQIHSRGRALADRIVTIWPGPDEAASIPPPDPHWILMNQVLASIPAGRWTSYSDVAEIIGSFQTAVGQRLAKVPTPTPTACFNVAARSRLSSAGPTRPEPRTHAPYSRRKASCSTSTTALDRTSG